MTLEEKLNTISNPKMFPLPSGTSKTIDDFWNDFIKPMLPNKTTVLKMHNMLVKYVNDPDAIFVVRAFGSWCKNAVESDESDELRRGFITIPDNASFRYFFSDNFYAAYFVKMVYDDYCPSYEEFKAAMINRVFPARFGRSCKLERNKAAYSVGGKDPGISKSGYKIAHIVDAGNHFSIDSLDDAGINELAKVYSFPRGRYSDWKKEMVDGVELFVRHHDVSDNTLKVLKSHFLRFVDPLNYFLAPKAKWRNNYFNSFTNNILNDVGYDIAEYKPLLDYVSDQFKQIYGKDYEDFLTMILLPKDFIKAPNGQEIIDITYGFMSFSGPISKPSHSNRKMTSQSGSGIGKYAKQVFENLLKENKLSSDLIRNLSDRDYCKKEFGIRLPVLQSTITPQMNGRYYSKPSNGYYICNDWYSKSRTQLDNWLLTNNFLGE